MIEYFNLFAYGLVAIMFLMLSVYLYRRFKHSFLLIFVVSHGIYLALVMNDILNQFGFGFSHTIFTSPIFSIEATLNVVGIIMCLRYLTTHPTTAPTLPREARGAPSDGGA